MPTLRQSNMAIENHHLRIVFPFEKVLMHNWSSSQPTFDEYQVVSKYSK